MVNYYDENSKRYIESTLNCDMKESYEHFLNYLSEGVCLLDAGCGSGRDTLHFLNLGFRVNAFDMAEEMVKSASKLTGIKVHKLGFLDIDYDNNYDAVWACASLLHLNREELPIAFKKLHTALKPNGIMYCSFKIRDKDFSSGSRIFTCFNEESFKVFINELNLFDILEIYITHDGRDGRFEELWMNAIIRKK